MKIAGGLRGRTEALIFELGGEQRRIGGLS